MNPTGTNLDGDQTVPSVDNNVIDDQNPEEDQHTLPNADAPDHHPEGEHDPNQHPNANQESFRPPTLESDEGEADTGIYIPALRITMNNIQALKNATLDKSGMAPDDVVGLPTVPCTGTAEKRPCTVYTVEKNVLCTVITS